jgi:Holliday junction resolvase RusA-like endonuclease
VLAFDVFGEAAPQGSKKAYVVKGRAVLVESSSKVKPWRASVAASAHEAAHSSGWLKTDGPVAVEVTFWLKRPASVKRPLPERKPDIDKLLRGVLDGISDSGAVWADDARVVDVTARKRYADDFVGASITVTPAEA